MLWLIAITYPLIWEVLFFIPNLPKKTSRYSLLRMILVKLFWKYCFAKCPLLLFSWDCLSQMDMRLCKNYYYIFSHDCILFSLAYCINGFHYLLFNFKSILQNWIYFHICCGICLYLYASWIGFADFSKIWVKEEIVHSDYCALYSSSLLFPYLTISEFGLFQLFTITWLFRHACYMLLLKMIAFLFPSFICVEPETKNCQVSLTRAWA